MSLPAVLPLPPDAAARSLYFKGCYGFGDNFYQRPVIRFLAARFRTTFLETAFPEVYWDIPNVRFILPPADLPLRTQRKHMLSRPVGTFVPRPPETQGPGWQHYEWSFFPPSYSHRGDGMIVQVGFPREYSNAEYIRRKAGIGLYDFHFPVKEEWVDAAQGYLEKLRLGGRKFCLFRPATVRKEWRAPARNPKPQYLQLLLDEARDAGYFVYSIADLEEGEEWFDGEPPLHLDAWSHGGELPIEMILGLFKLADLVICSPGIAVPAAVAIGTKCFCAFGGMQKPETIAGPPMPLENYGFVAPEPFCNCYNMNHACAKGIPRERIVAAFSAFLAQPKVEREITVGVPPGMGDIHWIMTKMEAFKRVTGARLAVAVHEDQGHRMSAQYLELLPFVDRVIRLPGPLYYDFGIRGGAGDPLYRNAKEGLDYKMEFNSELERGRRLEEILPELGTNWDYPILDPPEHRTFAQTIISSAGGRPLFLIYTSSCGANMKWAREDWTINDWFKLINLYAAFRNGASPAPKVVLLGAPWDREYADGLLRYGPRESILDLVGKTNVPQVLALLREASFFVSYPSGLSVMSIHFGTPTAMFMPITGTSRGGEFGEGFLRSWLPPWALEDKARFALLPYGSPGARPEAIWERARGFL